VSDSDDHWEYEDYPHYDDGDDDEEDEEEYNTQCGEGLSFISYNWESPLDRNIVCC
jgi:hypothetical protein